jgi:SAM-dependent methyltransferase
MSLLDVGCGKGTWLRAALDLKIADLMGIDGIELNSSDFLVSKDFFQRHDLSLPFYLGRRFDILICLEVAEHLRKACAKTLIDSLCRHSNFIIFSAACPGQPGECHINGQWPEYWQEYFNANGFECDDSIRFQLWTNTDIDVWYRQNIFIATKVSSQPVTQEPIKRLIHPEFMSVFLSAYLMEKAGEWETDVWKGHRSIIWYLKSFTIALLRKVQRKIQNI